MLRFAEVKQAVRLLSRFILWSILLILVLGSLVVLHRYVIGYDPTRARAGNLLMQLIDALRTVYPVSIMTAAVLSLFATLRTTARTFVPVIILALFWTALLLAGTFFQPAVDIQSAGPIPAVPEDEVIRAGEYRLYTARSEGYYLRPLLVDTIGRQPGFELFQEAVIDPERRSLAIPGRPDVVPDLTEIESSYPAMVESPERLRPLIRDIREVNSVLGLGGSGRQGVLIAVALGVFLLSCWTLARVTRWPLFNALLVFLALRFALWLVSAVNNGLLTELVTAAVDSSRLGLVAAGALAFCAAVLFVVLVILPPLESWKREVGHE